MRRGICWSRSSKSRTPVTWRPKSNKVVTSSRAAASLVAFAVSGAVMSVGFPELTEACSSLRRRRSEAAAETGLYLQIQRLPPSGTGALGEYMDITLPLDYTAIERILPHRYPFLLVDRIIEFEVDKRIVGIKNVSRNDRYLSHALDGSYVLPPTILTEAVAQVGAIMILAKPENRQ